MKRFKRFFKPARKPKFKPHKPEVYFQIILVLLMASSVLIIPTADKATFYMEKQSEYNRYAENVIDENSKTFFETQTKRYEEKAKAAGNSFILGSACAIISVLGVMGYLDKKKKFFLATVYIGAACLLYALISLVYSIMV